MSKIERIKRNCLVCNKEFWKLPNQCKDGRGKFCSRECFHKGQSLNLTTHKPRTYITFTCQNCGIKFEVIKRPYNGKVRKSPQYCSRLCHHEAMRNRVSRSRVNETQRRREIKDASCEICGFDRFIEVCHIIPAVLGGGFEEENILYLCPNHHRLFDNQLILREEWGIISGKVKLAFDKYGIPLRYRVLNIQLNQIDGYKTVVMLKKLMD